jgi:hypothetical protein
MNKNKSGSNLTGRQATTTTTQTRSARQATPPTPAQILTVRQATPARQPVTLLVRSTGEMIDRVLIERSGYRVVRYGSRYHVVRGGGRTAPYIIGHEDTDDVLGVA